MNRAIVETRRLLAALHPSTLDALGLIPALQALEVVGYCEPKPGIEPSPADVRQLAETMAREGARLIIHAPVYSPRISQAVAREVERRTGQPVRVMMLPAHVGGVPEAKDYFALFDYLLAKLREALG